MSNKRIKKNTFYSIIKSCSTILFPLITFPYITRVLRTENVGKVNFSISIVSYFSLIASLGITIYAVRECSKVKKNKNDLEKIASEIFSINICTTIISYIALFVLLLNAKSLVSYRGLICILSSAIGFTTLGADWLNTAMEDFKYVTIRTFLFQLLSLLLMFTFVKTPEDYVKYAIITVISSSGGNLVNIFYRKKYCNVKFVINMRIKKHISSIIMLFAMFLAQQIFVNSDITILGLYKGDYEVGLYSAAVKIYNIISTLMSSISWVVMAQLSYSFSKQQYEEVNKLLKYVIGFTVTIGIPCIIGIGILAPQIVEIIAGPAYIDASIALRILAIALAFSLVWGIVMNMILLPSGADKPCLKACSISAVVNIVANLIFVPNYGIVAASVTTALSQLIGVLICLPYVDKQIKIPKLKQIIFGPLVGGILIMFYLIVCVRYICGLWKIVIISLSGSVIIYFIIQIMLKNEWVMEFLEGFRNKLSKISMSGK